MHLVFSGSISSVLTTLWDTRDVVNVWLRHERLRRGWPVVDDNSSGLVTLPRPQLVNVWYLNRLYSRFYVFSALYNALLGKAPRPHVILRWKHIIGQPPFDPHKLVGTFCLVFFFVFFVILFLFLFADKGHPYHLGLNSSAWSPIPCRPSLANHLLIVSQPGHNNLRHPFKSLDRSK